MNAATLRRLGFTGAVCLLSLPWLAPCTFGIGTAAAVGVKKAADLVLKDDPSEIPLPEKQLREWAAKPGPKLDVRSVSAMPASLLIAMEDLDRLGARQASRTGGLSGGARGVAGASAGMIASLLVISDALTVSFLEKDNSGGFDLPDLFPSAGRDRRRQLVLCQSPFVLLQGDSLRYVDSGNRLQLAVALADCKVTVISPAGTFSGIAQRIHYRAGSSEVILQGNPTVMSGDQFIKGTRQDAMMRLDFQQRRVTVLGPVK